MINGLKNNVYAMILVTSGFWGFSFVGSTVLMKYMMPLQVLGARWTVAAALFLIMVISGKIRIDLHRPHLKMLLITAACQPCIYSILEIYGLKNLSVSISSIFIATIPCMTLVVGAIFFRSSPGIKGVLGIIIAFTGVVICTVFLPDFSIAGDLKGYLFMMGAVTVGAFYSYTSAEAGKSYQALEVTAVMAFAGFIVFNGINLFRGRFLDTYVQCFTHPDALFWMMVLGFGCSFLCYLCFNKAVTLIEPSIVGGVIPNLVTVIGIIGGVYITGDPAGIYTVIGCALTLFGVWLSGTAATTKPAD